MATRYKAHHGFTLTALLVVIAIISIMAAMILPVLSKARRLAIQTICVSNLKQVYVGGFMHYVDDFGGFISGVREGPTWPKNRQWDKILYDYYFQKQIRYHNEAYFRNSILWCPERSYNTVKPGAYWNTGYGMQYALPDRGWDPGYYTPTRMNTIRKSSQKGLVSDSWDWHTGWNLFNQFRLDRHVGGGTVLFCDGHSRLFPPGTTSSAYPLLFATALAE